MKCGVKKLSELAEIALGQTFRGKAETDDPFSGTKLVQIKDITEGILSSTERLPYADIDPCKLRIELRPGDLLLPLRGSRFTACIYAPAEPQRTTTTNQVAIIRPNESIVSLKFMLWFFNSSFGGKALSAIARGTTVASIGRADLSKLQLPVPSKHDQQRIVDIYECWGAQKRVLGVMLENGEELTNSLCLEVLGGSESVLEHRNS